MGRTPARRAKAGGPVARRPSRILALSSIPVAILAVSSPGADLATLRRQLVGRTNTTAHVIDQMGREDAPVAPGGQAGDPAPAAQAAVAHDRNTAPEAVRKELDLESDGIRRLEAEVRRRRTASGEGAVDWAHLQRDALLALGDCEFAAGHYAAAVDPYRQALLLTDEQKDTVLWSATARGLASTLCAVGRFADAEPLVRQVLDQTNAAEGGPDHPGTLLALNDVADVLRGKGDIAGAEALYRRCLEARERTLGKEDPDTLASVNNLANLLAAESNFTAAEALYRRALEAQERTLEPDDEDTLATVNNLAHLLYARNDLAGAETAYRRVLAARERTGGKEDPDTLDAAGNVADLLRAKGDYAGAEAMFRRCLEARERTLGKDDADTLESVNDVADTLYAAGKYADAEPFYRRCLEGRVETLGQDNASTL